MDEFIRQRYFYTFLCGSSRLSIEEKGDLIVQATIMYLQQDGPNFNEKVLTKHVKGENYDGVLFTEGKYATLGVFGGMWFDAELGTNDGKVHLSFLVSEQTRGQSAAMYSRN